MNACTAVFAASSVRYRLALAKSLICRKDVEVDLLMCFDILNEDSIETPRFRTLWEGDIFAFPIVSGSDKTGSLNIEEKTMNSVLSSLHFTKLATNHSLMSEITSSIFDLVLTRFSFLKDRYSWLSSAYSWKFTP